MNKQNKSSATYVGDLDEDPGPWLWTGSRCSHLQSSCEVVDVKFFSLLSVSHPSFFPPFIPLPTLFLSSPTTSVTLAFQLINKSYSKYLKHSGIIIHIIFKRASLRLQISQWKWGKMEEVWIF